MELLPYLKLDSNVESATFSADENNSIPTTVHALPTEKDDLATEQGASGSSSTGKLTTWSNIGKQSSSGSRSGREENNNNNSNGDSGGDLDRQQETRSRKSRSLDDTGRERSGVNTRSGEEEVAGSPNDGRLLNAFMRNRGGEHLDWDENAEDARGVSPSGAAAIPMMRSKDTVNQFLKAAATRQLTSIEENSGERSPTFAGMGAAAAAVIPVPAEYSSSKPPLPPRSHPRKHLGSGANADAPSTVSSSASSSVRKYPDLNFLENDVGLWDAFFMHGKNSSKFPSVLRHPQQNPAPPPPPRAVAHPAPPARTPSASADYSAGAMTHHRQKRNSIPAVLDSESLRTLLPPSAHKHLMAEEAIGGRASPITQVCQSLSRLTSKNDLQNEAIKSMFGQQQQQQQQEQEQQRRLKGEDDDGVKVVRVKEAWAEVPAREQVVMRRARKEKDERNMNLINNNNSSQPDQDSGTKRRSYHPQDYLSQVLVQEGEGETRHRGRRRRAEFPKVNKVTHFSPEGGPGPALLSFGITQGPFQVFHSRDELRCYPSFLFSFSLAVRTTFVIPGLPRRRRKRRPPASPLRAGRREIPRSPRQSTRSTQMCACHLKASTLISHTREVSPKR